MINRSILKTSPAALSPISPQLTRNALIAITEDGFGLASVLAEKLSELGYQAIVTPELPPICDVAVILDAFRPFHSQDQALAINLEVFEQVQRIAAHFSTHGGVLIAVEDCGGQFGTSITGPLFSPWAAGVSGLIKTAAQEWPKSRCKVIDLQRADQTLERLALRLLAEIMVTDQAVEIGLLADGRRISLTTEPIPAKQAALPLQENALVLVTGGARGVTAACLIALAQKIKLRLVLLGRTALEEEAEFSRSATSEVALKQALFADYSAKNIRVTPKDIQTQVSKILGNREIAATIHNLEQLGSTVRYLAIDVLDQAALEDAVKAIRQEWGEIHGIIHGAGVLADKLITEKTSAQFSWVFNTKVLGLRNLLAVTAQNPLLLLVLFSSVAGRFGNPGQADYAMANEVLNKVAQHYRHEHPQCLVKAINWGPWEGGMVTEQIKQLFAQRGVAILPVADGTRMFVEELQTRDAVEVVIGGELPATVTKASSPAVNHPSPVLPRSGVGKLELRFAVDQHSHPYLIDHTVQETPVLPACFALEWFVTAAKKYQPELFLAECRNFRVLRGVPLKDFYHRPQEFIVSCEEKIPGSHILNLTLHTQGQLAPNYAAEIVLSEQPISPSTVIPGDFSQAAPWPYDLADVYDDAFTQRLLFHGPQFQALIELGRISDHMASATIKGAQAMAWPGEWHTDALAIDAVFQIGRLWGERMLGRRSLPTAFASMRLFDPRPQPGQLHCLLFNCHTKGNFQIIVDAIIQHSDGHVYAEFKGIEGVCYDL